MRKQWNSIAIAMFALALTGCLPPAEPREDPHAPPLAMLEQHDPPDALQSMGRSEHLDSHEPECPRIDVLPELDRYDCMIHEAIIHEGHRITPENVKAQIFAESSGREDAVSPAGAIGPIQMLPSTFRSMLPRGDIHDPEDNIRAGVKYRVFCALFWRRGLRSEEERFGPLSLGCFNAGPGGMLDAQGECGGYTFSEIGPCAPRETRDYVVRVEGMEQGRPAGFWL